MIPAIIGAIGSIVGSVAGAGIGAGINRKTANDQADKAYSQSLGLMKMQDYYNRQWWKDYGSPAAMVRQYEEAGLNKGLMYSQGGAGGQMATTPSATAGMPNPANIDLTSAMQSGAQLGLISEQINNLAADTQLKKNEAANDPMIRDFMTARESNIGAAMDKFDTQAHDAMQEMQRQLSEVSKFSDGGQWSITKSKSAEGSNTYSFGLQFTSSDGTTYNSASGWNVGANVNVGGLSKGIGGQYGENNANGHGGTTSQGEGHNTSQGKSFGWAVAEGESHGSMTAGNHRSAAGVIDKAVEEIKRLEEQYNKKVEFYEENYNQKVQQYLDQKAKQNPKSHLKRK